MHSEYFTETIRMLESVVVVQDASSALEVVLYAQTVEAVPLTTVKAIAFAYFNRYIEFDRRYTIPQDVVWNFSKTRVGII